MNIGSIEYKTSTLSIKTLPSGQSCFYFHMDHLHIDLLHKDLHTMDHPHSEDIAVYAYFLQLKAIFKTILTYVFHLLTQSDIVMEAMKYLFDIPVHMIMNITANYISIRIDHITYKYGNLLWEVDYIQSGSSLHKYPSIHMTGDTYFILQLLKEKILNLEVEIGPFKMYSANQQPSVVIHTASTVSMKYHFESLNLSIRCIDTRIHVGMATVHMNSLIHLLPKHSDTAKPKRQNNMMNSINRLFNKGIWISFGLELHSTNILYAVNLNEQLTITNQMEVEKTSLFISSSFRSNQYQPIVHFQITQLEWFISLCTQPRMQLVGIQSIELKVSSSIEDYFGSSIQPTLSQHQFISVTAFINKPICYIDLTYKYILDSITETRTSSSSLASQDTHVDLPQCAFTLVCKSSTVQWLGIGDTTGYVYAKSIIMRLSSEYIFKLDNNTNIPAFISEVGNFDAIFARQEYQWLNASHVTTPFPSDNITRSKQDHLHRIKKSAIKEAVVHWICTARDVLQGKIDRLPEMISRPVKSDKRYWNYRVSGKCIIQQFDLGCYGCGQSTIDTHPFICIQQLTMTTKTNLHVDSIPSYNRRRKNKYEVVMSLERGIHCENNIDNLLVQLWDGCDGLSPSVYWSSLIPSVLRSNKLQEEEVKQERPVWISQVLKKFYFSVDITDGQIVMIGMERRREDTEDVPQYINNYPSTHIVSQFILTVPKVSLISESIEGCESKCTVRCYLEKTSLHQSTKCLTELPTSSKDIAYESAETVLWISKLSIHFTIRNQAVSISINLKKYGIRYSLSNHYACLLLIRSLKQGSQPFQKKNRSPIVWDIVKINVKRGDILICLPAHEKLYVRLDNTVYDYRNQKIKTCFLENLTVMGVSPQNKFKWDLLIEIDELSIHPSHQTELDITKLYLRIPYKYILSRIIDSIINSVKTVKELHAMLLTSDLKPVYTYFGPHPKEKPLQVPNITAKTKLFSIHFEDDPLEARLRNIFRTGKAEQEKRMAYEEALEDKKREMIYAETRPKLGKSSTVSSSFMNNKKEEPSPHIPFDPQLHHQLQEVEKDLLEKFSKMWIKNINAVLSKEEEFYDEMYYHEDYRNSATEYEIDRDLDDPCVHTEDPNDLVSNEFIIHISPKPLYPPLANFSTQFGTITIRPSEAEAFKSRCFVHEIGGQVPLDKQFSALIPFFFSIETGRTWIKLRDYPLPLLYVPANQVDDSECISWSLNGQYVIVDETGSSKGSRIVPVPIVPSGYTLSCVRNGASIKFYSKVDYTIWSKGISSICWSPSYSPAVQHILRVLETIAMPKADPSPRLGFWDKVRLSIHTRVKYDFRNGSELAFVVKGTRNPYTLTGRGAGLTKVWNKQVISLLGYSNPESEFLQIMSQEFILAVPDLIKGGYVPELPDSPKYDREKIQYESNCRFSKVILRLTDGVRLGIGLHFERFLCNPLEDCATCGVNLKQGCKLNNVNRCRTQDFLPHHTVTLKSPEYVNARFKKGEYDAYNGFRSNFLHLSISIIKLNNGENKQPMSSNAMYLTPCTITHFAQWLKNFGGPLSFPVRQGSLYTAGEVRRSVSFGEHLDTIKYKIMLQPLAISFFCTDQDHTLIKQFVGLKAQVKSFSMDLHKRREIVLHHFKDNEVTKEHIQAKRIFHESQLQLVDIDLRAIKTTYTSPSKQRSSEVEDGATTNPWMDPRDYVLFETVPGSQVQIISHTEVHPFVFAPLVYHGRQNDETGTEKRDYLRQTHDCMMKKPTETTEFQKNHLNQRATELDAIIDMYDDKLESFLTIQNERLMNDPSLSEKIQQCKNHLNRLYARRFMLQNYLSEFILEAAIGTHNKVKSSQSSVSSITKKNTLSEWESLMGHFKDRYLIHNPQIIWNNSVRDVLYQLQEVFSLHSIHNYNLSTRCLKSLQELVANVECREDEEETSTAKEDSFSLDESDHDQVPMRKLKRKQKDEPLPRVYMCEEIDNADDPFIQRNSIPNGYDMRSSFVMDMINPQINLQSDKTLDHLILVTNERILIKGFDILDNTNKIVDSSVGVADKDIHLVKTRFIANLNNLQLLIARRREMTEFDVLLENSYGQSQHNQLHWTAWVTPEQLWYHRQATFFESFQRIASHVSGTAQIDRYNPLRIKTSNDDMMSFEDRSNTFQVYFPDLIIALNSIQGNIVYETLSNLLLGNDGSIKKKKRTRKLSNVMLAATRSDMRETVGQVEVLQIKSRNLYRLHKRFMKQMEKLSTEGVSQFNENWKQLNVNLEKLYLIVEAIKTIQTFRTDSSIRETDTATRFALTARQIEWEAMNDDNQSSLCHCILLNTKLDILKKPTGSSKAHLEVEEVKLKDTTPSAPFTYVLEAYNAASISDSSAKKMLQVTIQISPPVGGIQVIRQLEIRLMPVNLQISSAFGLAMKKYLFPSFNKESLANPASSHSESAAKDFLDSGSDESEEEEAEEEAPPKIKRSAKREGSFASLDLFSKKEKKMADEKRMKTDELSLMKRRSSTNKTFISIHIHGATHCLSLQGPTDKSLYNIYNLPFKLPNIEYKNVTWSTVEIVEAVQKEFIRAIIRQSPSIFKSKVLGNRRTRKTSISSSTYEVGPDSLSTRSRNQSSQSLYSYRRSFTTEEEDNNEDIQSLYSIAPEESKENGRSKLHRKNTLSTLVHKTKSLLKSHHAKNTSS
ncbi:golgi-body localization protein domain-containing protein [Pilobolus umbonatus]|nr:golgi-body localization protein domain-containing protein [Pilobolus umbonatus]